MSLSLLSYKFSLLLPLCLLFYFPGGDQYFFYDQDPNAGLEDGEFTILGVTYQFALRDYLETVIASVISAAQYLQEGSGHINVVFSATITSDPHLKGFRYRLESIHFKPTLFLFLVVVVVAAAAVATARHCRACSA